MDNTSNVLICIPCLMVGGTEVQTLHLVEALREGGHEVVVCCYFEYNFNIVQQFKATGATIVCLSAYGKRPKSLRETRRFLRDGLRRVVKEYHPRIAHVQYMAPGALPLLYLHRLRVPVLLATLHTSADIYSSHHLIHFLQRHLVRAFTCVTLAAEKGFFCNSQLFDPHIQLNEHNHFTIYNCTGKGVKHSRKPLHPYPTIGTILRLEHIKGADIIVPAFCKVRRSIPNARLIIVGDGTLRAMMEQQQKEMRLPADSILWRGRLTPNQLYEQYALMDIAWVPSRSEGFGLTAIEAMAQGVPVIATDIGGLSEIVTDGENGLLVPPEDTDALADTTTTVLNDDIRLQRLSLAGIQRAQYFTFEKYKENILALYSKI